MKNYRYPRTLNEAFGPYASELAPLRKRYDPMPKADRIVVWASVLTGAIVLVLTLAGVIQ